MAKVRIKDTLYNFKTISEDEISEQSFKDSSAEYIIELFIYDIDTDLRNNLRSQGESVWEFMRLHDDIRLNDKILDCFLGKITQYELQMEILEAVDQSMVREKAEWYYDMILLNHVYGD